MTSTNNSRISGVWNGSSSPSATEIVGTNVTKSGIELNDLNSNFISFPQIQNNSNAVYESDMEFLADQSPFTVLMWMKPNWGGSEGPGGAKIYKPWNFGGCCSLSSFGLYHKWQGSDRPVLFGYKDGNAIWSDSQSDPPAPWDELYNKDTWTFVAFTTHGGQIGVSDNGYGADAQIVVGTGAAIPSNMHFYSGDGSAEGYDSINVRGGYYYDRNSSSSDPLIELDKDFSTTLGVVLDSSTSALPTNHAYWPGYFSDYRIYNRVLSTGELRDIFTGEGNY